MTKPIDEVLTRLQNVKHFTWGWTARCPAHDDQRNSLSLKVGDDERVLTKCHAGCQFSHIADAIGLSMSSFFSPQPFHASSNRKNGPKPKTEIITIYDYHDATGQLLYQVCRTPDKQFPQRRPDGKGGWIWGMGDVEPVLYRLPQLLAAIQEGHTIYITEGEKDVDRLFEVGLVATTNPMGAGKWRDTYTQSLQGCKDVVILPDNDPPGLAHAEMVASILYHKNITVKVVQLPDLPLHGDISDWLDHNETIEHLNRLVETSPIWAPASIAKQSHTTGFNLTDYGNAERLVAQHGQDLRYCYLWQSWLAWDGLRWHRDAAGEVLRRAKESVRDIYTEARSETDEQKRQALAKHAVRSEGSSKVNAMIYLAQSEPGIPIQPDELDSDPWLLNVLNGTLDLRTGDLLPHHRNRLCTKLAPVPYEKNTTCPLWQKFLSDIMAGNTALITFLQRAVGYSLTAFTQERALFFLHGTGRNGKTTFLETLQFLLGDYAEAAEFSSFLLQKHDNNIRNDIAKLKGARFVSSIETKEGARFDVSTVKQLTGGDTITARFLYGEFFNFRPVFKLWLAANHKPDIRDTTDSTWDRVKLVPFLVRFDRPDLQLPKKLKAELPGILTWAVQGCLEWQKFGLGEPSEVIEATNAYREEMDPLAGFLKECCILQPTSETGANELYSTYKTWCDRNNESIINQHKFGKLLKEKGLSNIKGTSGQNKGRKVWIGIRLSE